MIPVVLVHDETWSVHNGHEQAIVQFEGWLMPVTANTCAMTLFMMAFWNPHVIYVFSILDFS